MSDKFLPGDKVKANRKFDCGDDYHKLLHNMIGTVLGYEENATWPVLVLYDDFNDEVEYKGQFYKGYVFEEKELDLISRGLGKELI